MICRANQRTGFYMTGTSVTMEILLLLLLLLSSLSSIV